MRSSLLLVDDNTEFLDSTAEEFSELINEAMNENVFACINKPIDINSLLAILKKVNPNGRQHNTS